jgi:release factor glutamine methyltransferase
MTVEDALQSARKQLAPVSDSASLDAQVLLSAALGVDRSFILAHPEHALSDEQAALFTAWVARCATGEPLPYVLGRRAFYDRDFYVAPGVLIPRPETELLLEQALAYVQARPRARVVDVGTGSGALAVTLAARCPQATVYATDISPQALAIATRNADQHRAQVTFYKGDLVQPLIDRGLQVDVVMANPPYIASGELDSLAVSRHEPRLALDGGADGLDVIRRLLALLPRVCVPGALVLVEIGADQGAAALALAQAALTPSAAVILRDYAGLDRILRLQAGSSISR